MGDTGGKQGMEFGIERQISRGEEHRTVIEMKQRHEDEPFSTRKSAAGGVAWTRESG